jgi:two-component system sensor histidine kinase VicK
LDFKDVSLLKITCSICFFISTFFSIYSCKHNIAEDNDEVVIREYTLLSNNVLERASKTNKLSTINYLDSLKKVNSIEPNSISDYNAACLRVEIYKYFGEIDSALILANQINIKIINFGKEQEYPKLYARIYFQLSDINYSLKNYPEAYKFLYLGKKPDLKVSNNYILSEYYYRLAIIQYKQESYLKAAGSFKTSFEKSNLVKNQTPEILYRQQEVLVNVGLSYFKAGNLDSAEYFYKKTVNFLDEKPRFSNSTLNIAKGVVLGNLGQLLAERKDYKKAIKYLNKSISINVSENGGNFDALLNSIQLGNVYLKINQPDSAKLVIDRINNQIEKHNDLYAKSNYYKLESDYFKSKNDIDQAFYYIEKQRLAEREIKKNEQNLYRVNVLEQLNSIENEINFHLVDDNSKSKTVLLIIASICLSFTIVIIVLVFFNLKRSKKNIKTLENLNKKVSQQANELKLKNLEKDKILRIVAHDLRNPIGGINSIAKIMLLDDIHEKDKEMVELIDNTSKDALVLINDILEFTNDNHTANQEIEKLSLNQLVINAVAILKYKITEKNQELIFNELKRDIEINGDREKLNRVISNLINNASKFSHQNKTIEINIELINKMAVISVKDQGIGIQEEFNGNEIESLAGNKRRGTSGEKSFGMGLSIANQIVEKHNGKLWFLSSQEGTIFYVELPINYIK